MAAPTTSLKPKPAASRAAAVAVPIPTVTWQGALKNSRFTVAVAAFLLANLIIAVTPSLEQNRSLRSAVSADKYSASVTGKTQSWWTAKTYIEQTSAPDVVLLGSSQMQCFVATDAKLSGHDIEQTLDHRCQIISLEIQKRLGHSIECFNASAGGSMLTDRVLIEKALFKDGLIPRMVILGVAPRDFIDNLIGTASSTEPFHFFAPIIGIDDFGNDSFKSALERITWQVVHNMPVRHLCNFIDPAKLIGMFLKPPAPGAIVQENHPFDGFKDSLYALRPGSCLIPHNAFEGFINNTHEYQARYNNFSKEQYALQFSNLDKLLSDMHKLGVEVLIVGMPMDEMNRALLSHRFWHDYGQDLHQMADKHHVVFCDLSLRNDYAHNDFADGVHLNWRGGQKLAVELADVIAAHPQLTAALKSASKESVAASGSTH